MRTRAVVVVVVGMLLAASTALDAKPAVRRFRKGYPSTCKIDEFLEAARSMTPDKRLAEARRIIAYVNSWEVPESDSRDSIWVWEYFLARWAQLFEELGASDIATAIDEAQVDGGLAESRCGFYYELVGLPAFAAHYKKLDLDQVVRCDFPDRLGNPLKVNRQPRRFSPASRAMTACAADRQVARLRGLTGVARRSAIAALIETAGEHNPADPDGVRYLNQVSTSVFQDADEAVFDALDAAAKHELTIYVCELYADTTWSKRFRPRYSRPDRRELIRPCEKDESIADDFERALGR